MALELMYANENRFPGMVMQQVHLPLNLREFYPCQSMSISNQQTGCISLLFARILPLNLYCRNITNF